MCGLVKKLSLTFVSLSFLLSHGVSAALDGYCPPLGPVLPAPTAPNSNAAIQSAVAALQETLQQMTAQYNFSAVSLGVKSIHEDTSMVEFHHTPPHLDSRGVSEIDSSTIYRIGSVSKVFAVLATLKADGVDLNDPITKYIPELYNLKNQASEQNAIFVVDWDSITLGALASHLSGIASDLLNDLANFPGPWTRLLGLPPIANSSLMTCASRSTPQHGSCTTTDFLQNFGKRPPIEAPFTRSAYSNIGTSLLSFAIERVTNKTYGEFVRQTILEPSGMNHTSIHAPAESEQVIPVNSTIPDDLGFEAAAGAYYSTLTDLLSFGSSILSHKLLPPAKTHAWLKPWSATSSRGVLVGAPWEIYHPWNVTVDGRLLELYTKSGGISTYRASLILIPDYDLSIAVLTAGPELGSGAIPALTAVRALLPAIEKASRDQAQAAYVGVYTDQRTNSGLELSLDSAPGLKVSNWTIRGVNVAANYARFNPSGSEAGPPPRVRLYPTKLDGGSKTAWRAVFDAPFDVAAAAQIEALFPWPDPSCATWTTVDTVVYGFEGVDLFVFEVGEDGKATGLTLPAYEVTLRRE